MNRPKRLQLVSSGSCGPSGPVEEAGSVGHNRLKLLLITGDGLALAVGYLSVILAVGFPASHGLLRSMGVVCSAVIIGLASMRSQGLFLARVSAVRVVELTRSTRAMTMLVAGMIVVDRVAHFGFRIRYIVFGALISWVLIVISRSIFRSWVAVRRSKGHHQRRVLVVGADAMSRITDPADRGTTILFGDGAGALVLEAADEATERDTGGLLSVDFGGDPASRHVLTCAAGGHIEMQGQAVFKVAVRAAIDSAERALRAAGIESSAVDLFVPHQANQRITDAIASRLGLAEHTVVSTIADTANTSAATVPAAIAVAADDGRLRDGHHLLLSGFGAGMTWAAAVLRWDSGGRTPATTGPDS